MLLPALQFGMPGGPELLVLFVLLSGLLPLVVAALVYRDAKGRQSDHALAWGLGSFFGGLVVWILYAVVRDEVGRGTSV